MFQCQVTGRMSEAGQKCNKIVVSKRDRVYGTKVRNEETGRWEDVELGRGWEIVREISATDKGLQVWEKMDEEARKALLNTDVNQRMHLTDE